MERRSAKTNLRGQLLSSASSTGLKSRAFALPVVAGAAMMFGVAYDADTAEAASCPTWAYYTGSVSVNGVCTNQGIAVSASGGLRVDLENATITDSATHGVYAEGNGNNVGVNFWDFTGGLGTLTTVSSTANGGNGVYVVNTGSGNVTVDTTDINALSGNVTNPFIYADVHNTVTGNASGIRTSAANGDTSIKIGADTITGQHTAGIYVTSTGGAITFQTAATSQIIGNVTNGAVGIYANSSTGNITGNLSGTVTGDWAVDLSTGGSGIINMTYGGNVTGTDGAIHQQTATGNNTVNITGNGTVIDGGSAGNASILANSTLNGNISITTAAGTLVTGAGNEVVVGASSGGIVSITTNGNVTGTAYLGNTTGIRGSNSSWTVDIHANGNVSATGTAILGNTSSGNITIYGNGTISGNADWGPSITGDGIHATSGTGGIAITTNGNGTITGGAIDGINASTGNTGATSNNIVIVTNAGIGSSGLWVQDNGIEATIGTAGSTGNISINVSGTIWSAYTGVLANNYGSGNITVITQKNMDINTGYGDGIDAFANNGGNVLVHLLDGAINSNQCGSGACPSSLALCLDPYGIHATAVGSGVVTVITDDEVHNIGPGAGIFTETVAGSNYVEVNNIVTNVNGYGVHAEGYGNGTVTVNVGISPNQAFVGNITSLGNATAGFYTGSAIYAEQYKWSSTANVSVNFTGNGTSAHVVDGSDNGFGGYGAAGAFSVTLGDGGNASVNVSGDDVFITVEGQGDNAGLRAYAIDGNNNGYVGMAFISTGNNTTITVGSLGGG